MLWSFALASLIIEMTPGPNMAYLALLGAERGRTAGYAAVLGVALGLAVAGLAASIGITALIAAVPAVYEVIRWFGVLYMLYLASEAWRGASADAQTAQSDSSRFRFFQRGLITNMLNPKAYLFYAAILPEFIDPARALSSQLLLLISIYVTVATIVHASIVTFFGALSAFIISGPSAQLTRRIFAVLLAGVAAWLAWSTAR
jgi:threonine/homoserine/homoserine lactone efflux protein